jgi:hypothetical protein
LRIGGIVLLTLDERLHISRRNQPHLVPQSLELTAPVMRAAARLQRHNAARLPGEERQHARPADPPAELHAPALVDAMHMKNMLGDIQSDRGNLFHGRLLR